MGKKSEYFTSTNILRLISAYYNPVKYRKTHVGRCTEIYYGIILGSFLPKLLGIDIKLWANRHTKGALWLWLN